MFFIWVSKVFNITNENILRMCNHFLEVQQSEYDNISMNTIFLYWDPEMRLMKFISNIHHHFGTYDENRKIISWK